MSIFESLMTNKGTVSTALGKKLAKAALDGDLAILDEAIGLSVLALEDKSMRHVRAGAAKIAELVAEKRPELVAPRLKELFPALRAAEPQTRWMAMGLFGACAHLGEGWAKKALPFAQAIIEEKDGLCLSRSADLFLGDFVSLSRANAALAVPLLLKSAGSLVRNEEDWVLEAFMKILTLVDEEAWRKILAVAKRFERGPKKSTQARAKRLIAMKWT